MLKAKGEILERAEKLKEVDAKAYHSLVDEVSRKYKKLKHVNSEDVARLSRELKAHWSSIEKDLGKRARSGKRAIKKVTKKVVKRAHIKKKTVSKKRSAKSKAVVKRGRSKSGSAAKAQKRRPKRRR